MTEPAQNPAADRAIGPGNTTRTISDSVARRIWVAAGGRCTFCNRWLLGDEVTGQQVFTGQLAHIVGWDIAEGSPRGDEPLPVDERNGAENLMLVCYDQHRVIDNKSLWDVYDVDRLRRFKRVHERKIRQLTDLAHENQTTVLRVIGTIHGAPVQVASSAIVDALLAEGRFPSYALEGIDEYEIDLRSLPGEEQSDPTYWASAVAFIRDRLRKLGALVAKEEVVDVSVFALARIPILIALGALLDDTLPTKVYPKRRVDGEVWGWPESTANSHDFEWGVLENGPDDPEQVTVVFSVSGSVEAERLPDEVTVNARVYEIRPVGANPSFDLVDTSKSLDAFGKCWRSLVAEIETHTLVTAVNLIPAVPTTVAVAIGRSVNMSVHPTMRVYDRVGHDAGYAFTLELQ